MVLTKEKLRGGSRKRYYNKFQICILPRIDETRASAYITHDKISKKILVWTLEGRDHLEELGILSSQVVVSLDHSLFQTEISKECDPELLLHFPVSSCFLKVIRQLLTSPFSLSSPSNLSFSDVIKKAVSTRSVQLIFFYPSPAPHFRTFQVLLI
jgi:hypothetical protein